MKIGKAIGIFCNINSDKYTLLEKGEAIYEVLQMPTHMSITKDDMLKAIDWLWNQVFEVGSKEPITDEEENNGYPAPRTSGRTVVSGTTTESEVNCNG